MPDHLVLAALLGVSLAGLALAIPLAASLRSWRSTRSAPVQEPLFLLRGTRVVDASVGGARLLARLDHPSGADGDGAPWSDLATLLRPVFPGLPADPPAPDSRVASADDPGLVLCAGSHGRALGISVTGGCAAAIDAVLTRMERAALHEGLDRAPYPIWRTDAEGHVTWSNARFRALSALCGTDSLFPEKPERAAQRQSRRASLRRPPAGGPCWFELTSQRAQDGWLHYAIEIDAVVEAEAAQRNFVQTLAKTFSHLPTGLAIFDRSQALVLFNPALCDLSGLSPEQLAHRPDVMSFFDMLRERQVMPEPRDYGSWRNEMAALIRAAREDGFADTWSLPSGLTYRITGRPHPDGAVAFLIDDISDEVSLTRRFRRELELAQSVIDAFDDAIAVFTAGGLLAFCNAGYRTLWNSDPDSDVSYTTMIEATRLWQATCAPTPVWGDLRAFVGQHGERAGWDAEVRRLDGLSLQCRIEPIHGGATLVRFVVPADEKLTPLPVPREA
ncbi:Sensor protein DivL [Roseivivax jejudonensis]|uniref:Sensor protein DivL n=1 Tax=Roseivivax jejudonensis TaxID=1529041 RepID=A0A1X6YM93_9RHOB|nr:PAS-domain containing protein [Roseivivax jejudonensis]SLN24628.1 Sensor protein DivL [Roseivivax jejudonensis]